MKILIAAFSFPPNLDGVAMVAATMASGFSQAGHEVSIATLPVAPARDSQFWNDLPVYEFKITGRGQPKRPYGGQVQEYLAFLRAGHWDVLIFHSYEWMLRLALGIMDSLPGRKVLVSHGHAGCQWVRFPRFPWGLGVWAWNLWDALKMVFWVRKLDHVVFLSTTCNLHEFLDHLIIKWSGFRNFSIIPNGIEPVAERPEEPYFRPSQGIPLDGMVFLCVANYSRRKDQGYAARAFRRAALPGSVLVFIGSEFNDFSKAFQEEDEAWDDGADGGKILWLQRLSREATLAAMAECDVFVLSSDHEALPLALLEAMREGKPWIARRSGCVDSLPGGLVVNSEKMMAQAMKKLSADSQTRVALGTKGRAAIVSTYNRQAYIAAYSRLIRQWNPGPEI